MLNNLINSLITSKDQIKNTIRIAAIIMAVYHFIAISSPIFPPEIHQAVHLGFSLTLIFMIDITIKKSSNAVIKIIDRLLVLFAIGVTCYLFFGYESLIARVGSPTIMDTIVGCLIIIMILDAVRRRYGYALMGLGFFALIYTYYGRYFPGFFHHSGYTFSRMISTMTTSFTGFFGVILQVSATYLILFMVLGAYFLSSGGGDFYVKLASALGGKLRSGPAMAALISSAIMGSINGSGIANVSTTGVFSIPLMKSKGYSPEFSAAVESSSSIGGMFLPPVMGVGAFVMAGITGISYATIAAAAIIPALIYYTSIGFCIHFRALHLDLKPLKDSEIPDIKKVLKEGGHFLIPILVIVYNLLVGFSPSRAALMGIISLFVVTVVRESIKDYTFITKLKFLKPLFDALENGVKIAIGLAAICAMMGLISYAVSITGLSFKILFLINSLTAGNQIYALVLVMITSLVFGMGVPPTTAYLLVAVLAAPALVQLGFSQLAAHLFIYLYCIMANLTPPIAPAVMVAARIANAKSYVNACVESIRLSLPGFILPFLFVFYPALLGQRAPWFEVLRISVTLFLGIMSISLAGEGFMFRRISALSRATFLFCGGLFILPGLLSDVIGLTIFVILVFTNYKKSLPSSNKLAAF